MKKILSNLIVVFCLLLIGGNANAQVCKISGSNDNIEVFDCQINDNTVTVTLSNDSNDIKANVTVTVEVKYVSGSRSQTKIFTGKALALPGASTKLDINIANNGWNPQTAQVTSISGTKCL